MSELDKLREALERRDSWLQQPDTVPMYSVTIEQAARDYLALLESDAIVIKRDAEGKWPEDVVNRFADAWHTGPVDLMVFIRRGFDALSGAKCEHGESAPHGPFMFRNPDGSIRRMCLGLADSSKAPE